MILCGGAALPRVLLEQFERRHRSIIQAWGMTETGPLAALAFPPKHRQGQTEYDGALAPAGSFRASSCGSSARTERCHGTAPRSARSRCAVRG